MRKAVPPVRASAVVTGAARHGSLSCGAREVRRQALDWAADRYLEQPRLRQPAIVHAGWPQHSVCFRSRPERSLEGRGPAFAQDRYLSVRDCGTSSLARHQHARRRGVFPRRDAANRQGRAGDGRHRAIPSTHAVRIGQLRPAWTSRCGRYALGDDPALAQQDHPAAGNDQHGAARSARRRSKRSVSGLDTGRHAAHGRRLDRLSVAHWRSQLERCRRPRRVRVTRGFATHGLSQRPSNRYRCAREMRNATCTSARPEAAHGAT